MPALVSNPPRWFGWVLLAFCLGLMLLRNQPWHLDDKDQAKQAFIAVEMLHEGGQAWWFQHTPDGEVATKPPLMGWINAGLRASGVEWNSAWRLPGLWVCGGLMVALLLRGRRLGPGWIALVPALAFGANLLTPRLAMLVRTDALLAGAVAWAVLAIYDALQARSTRRDASWPVVAALTAAAMLKGPIAWVFLLPGAVGYGIWRLVEMRRTGQSVAPLPVRWWAWVLPLVPFVAWSLAAMKFQPGFYEQVVEREFLGRFESGEDATHNVQNPLYYVLQLGKAFAPWVVGAIVLTVLDRKCWGRVLRDPGARWLLLAGLGGLLVMSLVPSKRLDRVYPIVVPLALYGGLVLAQVRHPRGPLLAGLTSVIALLAYAAYTVAVARERLVEEQAAFTRHLQEAEQGGLFEANLRSKGVDLEAGEVVTLENNYEALFVWQPDIRLVEAADLEPLAEAGELRVVLVRPGDRPKVLRRFPEARQIDTIPAPAEADPDKPLEVWLVAE